MDCDPKIIRKKETYVELPYYTAQEVLLGHNPKAIIIKVKSNVFFFSKATLKVNVIIYVNLSVHTKCSTATR